VRSELKAKIHESCGDLLEAYKAKVAESDKKNQARSASAASGCGEKPSSSGSPKTEEQPNQEAACAA